MRSLQRMLLRRIRDGSSGPVELPFRCDSPALRREMQIRIAASATGRAVLFRTSLRAERPRRPQALLDASAKRDEETLEMCGWCDRFLVDRSWVEVELASERLDLFRRKRLPTISHGVCPECDNRLLAA